MFQFFKMWGGEVIFFSTMIVALCSVFALIVTHDMNVESKRSVYPILLFEAHGCKVYEFEYKREHQFFHTCEKE